ncbi:MULTISPECIES: hypothetical protein [Lactobacillus]|uniref:hypothetical protein n=1 Tax=Lactobacillus TaxID=1578 RepID=UPI002492C42B|nr:MULTISPECIES: hypothetical protein [Lactobacillus]
MIKPTGYRGKTLPEYAGYHAVITDAQIIGGPQEAANKLFYEVNNWIKAHPNAT